VKNAVKFTIANILLCGNYGWSNTGVAEESNRCHPEDNPAIHTMVGKFNKFQESGCAADLPHSGHLNTSKEDGENTIAK